MRRSQWAARRRCFGARCPACGLRTEQPGHLDRLSAGVGWRGVVERPAIVPLLPCHDELRAKAVGEAIVASFAQTVSHRADGVDIQATVSIGLAHCADGAQSLAEMLAAADEALYRAKSLDGNRLEGAPEAARLKVVR